MDADCSHTGANVPACSANFSDNSASVTVVTESRAPAIQLADAAGGLALTASANNGVKGNKAVYGISFLHKLSLADYPGISFDAKLNAGDTTIEDDLYVTISVSPNCDGLSYVNLITVIRDMKGVGVPDLDGYLHYSAAPEDVKWYRTGSKPYPTSGPVLLNGVLNSTGGPAMSLDALKTAYPLACIWNFPNATTQVPGGVTPALDFNLGDSGTTTDKKAWIKSILIGAKLVF
jgi:hypothetical protein